MILLEEKRTEKNLNQAELAARSGVAQSTISAIERKTRKNVGVLTLEALARGLGIRFLDLYRPEERTQ